MYTEKFNPIVYDYNKLNGNGLFAIDESFFIIINVPVKVTGYTLVGIPKLKPCLVDLPNYLSAASLA